MLVILDQVKEALAAGRDADAYRLIESLPLPTADALEEPLVRGLALRATCLQRLCKWSDLEALCVNFLTALRRAGLYDTLREFHAHIGLASLRQGQYHEAEIHLRAAIHVATWDLGNKSLGLWHQRQLALTYKNLGLWQQAIHECRCALRVAEQEADEREIGLLCKNLAIILLKSASVAEVPELLERAQGAIRNTGRSVWIIRAQLVLARYLFMIGRGTDAGEVLTATAATARERSAAREEAISLEYLGDCCMAQRDFRKALEHYQAAQKIAEATAPKGDLIPELGHRLGEALSNLGDPNAAILHCEHGLRVARDAGDRYEECATYRVLAMAHRAAGNPTKARRLASEGIALGRQYEIPYELARTLQWSGETNLQSKGRDDQMIGRMQLWEARAIYERIGLPNMVRTLDRILGFEDEAESSAEDAGAAVIAGIEGLDKGALRFGIVTVSEDLSRAVATIQSVAPSRIPVLIMGESGVGKELLARALHRMSDRRKQAFVAVNCGALAPGLLDSELFGHERGAFTGAISSREGLFASADRGTLFLDEVGELSAAAQSTLLRILETGELRPVGRDEVKTIDVRIVAATNADLEELVGRGAFRRDLFYRLEGVSVKVPPLAEREEDVRALFRYFFAQAIAVAGKRVTVAEDVEPMLLAYAWPGNVRELKNEVARAVAMAQDGTVLGRDAFLPKLASKSPAALREAREREGVTAGERERILAALRAHRGNKADAARSLDGMKRTTLLYKMERLGIRPEEYQVKK